MYQSIKLIIVCNFIFSCVLPLIRQFKKYFFTKLNFLSCVTPHLKCMWMKNLITTCSFHVDEFLRLILLFLGNHFSGMTNMDAASAAFGVKFLFPHYSSWQLKVSSVPWDTKIQQLDCFCSLCLYWVYSTPVVFYSKQK